MSEYTLHVAVLICRTQLSSVTNCVAIYGKNDSARIILIIRLFPLFEGT